MTESIEQEMSGALHREQRARSSVMVLAAIAAMGTPHPDAMPERVPETPWLAVARKRGELRRIAAAEAKRERRKAKHRP